MKARISHPALGQSGAPASPPLTRALAPPWVAPVFLTLSVVLVPWIIYLGVSLPSRTVAHHYGIAWVGFDVLLVAAMARTAWLAIRRSRHIQFPAVVTATLLVVDAWFDVTTSRAGWQQFEAVALALLVELPTALLALYIARRVSRLIDDTLHHAAQDHIALGHGPSLEEVPAMREVALPDSPR